MSFTVDLHTAQAEFPEYKFIKKLPQSAQKAAFHVEDTSGASRCLKIINPSCNIDRVSREIQVLQQISHPNIVRLVDYQCGMGPTGKQRHFMVEEFVEGDDLTARLNGSPWKLDDARSFFSALCGGLEALRSEQIVHRDLKPSNIRVRKSNGAPAIIDFGLARLLQLPALTDSASGAALGTPTHFSPEQFNGTKHDIDHRTDLFAVGVIMYEAVTGKHPFYRPGMTYDQLKAVVSTSTDYLSRSEFTSLPKPWQTLITRLLEKERAKRPAQASHVVGILAKV